MKILDLYAGIGGNHKIWGDEHDITAVEINPDIAKIYQDFFPNDTMIVGDAHQYLLDHIQDDWDFIWSSPPCPTHSKARFGLGVCAGKCDPVYPDMKLYQEVILLQSHFKGKYCVENVKAYYNPLINPQSVGRHWYWSNFFIRNLDIKPSQISQQSKKYKSKNTRSLRAYNIEDFEREYDIDLSNYNIPNKLKLLRNCVIPKLGLHILKCSQEKELELRLK